MYTTKNFKSKKALKGAVQAYLTISPIDGQRGHIAVTCYSPGPFPCPDNGSIALEGPHYPEPHRWYASATIRDGIVIAVK